MGVAYLLKSKTETATVKQNSELGGVTKENETDFSTAGTGLDEKIAIAILTANPQDAQKTDVYLQDSNGKRDFFATIPNVYRDHIHPTDYYKGNLYIIRRFGSGASAVDELWKYDSSKTGTKLVNGKSLAFSLSPDEVVMVVKNTEEPKLSFYQKDGALLKAYTALELGMENINFSAWGKGRVWLTGGPGPDTEKIVKITVPDFALTGFDVASLPINRREFDLNVESEKIVFSDVPVVYDVDSAEEFRKNRTPAKLFVYDLQTKKSEVIATAFGKGFAPKWVDSTTIEYENPDGTDRITKKIN